MGQVTGFTAERMKAIEDGTVVDGAIGENGHLILTRHDETEIDAGQVTVDSIDNAWYRIAGIELAAIASSFDFQAIPQGYSALRLRARLRTNTATGTTLFTVSFNNDLADANYAYQRLQSVGSTTTSSEVTGAANSRNPWGCPGASAPAGSFGLLELDVPDYADATRRKICSAKNHLEQVAGASGLIVRDITTRWGSTAAINRITVATIVDSFIAGSRVDLYGLMDGSP